MDIRKARMMDKEEIYKMICIMQEKTLDKDTFDQIFWENMNHPFIYYIVAIEQDEVVGFASLHVENLLHQLGMIGQIQEFCITRSSHNEGVGDAMFDMLKKRAIGLSCVQLVVSNQCKYKDAIAFYKAHEMMDNQATCVLDLITPS